MSNVKIVGLGSYCPKNIVTNHKLEEFIDTSDEWIVKRTGIKERRISTDENTVDLAYKAAQNALNNSNLLPEDIDLIIVATTSGDRVMPSTACTVQQKLGCKNAVAFDVGAACSGFVYGMILANSLIKTKVSTKALVIGSEVLSKIVNWEDRNTCILFGDGAGACVLDINEDNNGIIGTYFGSDGEKGEKSLISGQSKNTSPFAVNSMEEKKYIEMDGKAVYRFATNILPQIIAKLLEDSGVDISEIKYIVPHQANLRIIKDCARKLDISEEKFYTNLEKYGNTSAASIPIALDEMNQRQLLNKGDKVILATFGGGLTWAGVLIEI